MTLATDAGRPGGQSAEGCGAGVLAHPPSASLQPEARPAPFSVGAGELLGTIGAGVARRPPDDCLSDHLAASSPAAAVGGGSDDVEWSDG